MTTQIDINDPKYREAARQMLWRHDNFEAEANVTSAVRDFLITTGLAASEEIVEENPPSEGSRRAVDLTALDTFIEVKRRISVAVSGYPNAEYVRQLDDYLDQSARDNRVRMGVLTDGRHWLLRWPGAWGKKAANHRASLERMTSSNSVKVTGEPPVSPSVARSSVVT